MDASRASFDFALGIQVCAGLTCCNALMLFVPLWGPRVVFRKLVPRVRDQPPARFSVIDLIVLLTMLAAANAFAPLLRSEFSLGRVVLVLLGANVLVAGTWLLGLRHLTRSEIRSTNRRVLFQVVLHPLAIVGPAGIITSGMILFSSLEMFDGLSLRKIVDYVTHPLMLAAWLTLVVSLFICFMARSLFRWSLSRVSRGEFIHPNNAAAQSGASPDRDGST